VNVKVIIIIKTKKHHTCLANEEQVFIKLVNCNK